MTKETIIAKKQGNNQLVKQLVLVFFAFLITIASSLFAIVGVMSSLLNNSAEKTLSMIGTNVDNTIANIDMVFGSTYYYIKRRINEGADNQQILQIKIDITDWLISSNAGQTFPNGVYGFIRGEYLDGSGWEPGEDYIPTERPWFIDALAADGKPVTAAPYIDAMTGQLVTGVSQTIFDSSGNFLGVISVDAYLNELFSYVKELRVEGDGYIILMDNDKNILSHSDTSLVGINAVEANPRLIPFFHKIDHTTKPVVGKRLVSIKGQKLIISMKRTQSGWYLLTAILEEDYYAIVHNVAFILVIIGFLGFAGTAYILYRLNKQRKTAVEANVGKTAFLARMSHELRTPLNAINGFAEIELRKKHGKDTQDNIIRVLSSGNTLLGIINDILDVSKIESGKLELLPNEYNSATLINDVVNMNRVRIGEKNIQLKLTVGDNIPEVLFGDEIRVKQIINNVLSNAIKYTVEGEVSVAFSAVMINDTQCKLNVDVNDTGIGISKENITKLFCEYSRIEVEKHRQIEGTGLGLHITKKLAEKMGGDIKVESEYGKGSSFRISITQIVVGDDFIPKKTIEQLQNLDLSRDKTSIIKAIDFVSLPDVSVLIVDDVQTNLDVAAGIMSPYDMNIDTLLSGEEALALMESGVDKYKILFIDHMMPGMDGIECVTKIRQLNSQYAKTVPIIVLTANAVVGMENTFLNAGFSGFISKPINTNKLDEIIHEFIIEGKKKTHKVTPSKIMPNKELPKIDGIDLGEGIKKFNGNLDIYLRVLNSFVKNIPERLSIISKPEEKKLADYGITVHGIKGSLYGINANNLGDKAAVLEKLAKENEFSEIQKQNSQFLKEVEKLIDDLKKFIESEDSVKPAKEKIAKPDTELLQKILIAAQDYDNDEMNKTLEKLEKFDYENGSDLIAQIKQSIDKFDYEAISNTIEKYLET